jgi:DNA-binding NarL/FixJ family response regulator
MAEKGASMIIRVLLVDDHPLVRAGLRRIVEPEPDLEIIGDADDGAGALRLARELLPDVVVTDLLLPDIDGVEVTRRLREELPHTQLIVLTGLSEEDEALVRVVRAGAVGYVPKDAHVGLLLDTIRAAAHGRANLSPRAAARLIQEVREPGQQTLLSRREREILCLVALGQANKEIAASLSVSETTVKTHVCSIFNKLGVQSRTQAALKALELGLVSTTERTALRSEPSHVHTPTKERHHDLDSAIHPGRGGLTPQPVPVRRNAPAPRTGRQGPRRGRLRPLRP